MQPSELDALAEDLGLSDFLPDLRTSRLEAKREALMAAVPHLWGLRIWINGETMVLLDEKGFVCSTLEPEVLLRLLAYESHLGPGALRALLSRPVIDPDYIIVRAEARKTKPMPEVKPRSAKREKLALSPEALSALLKEL